MNYPDELQRIVEDTRQSIAGINTVSSMNYCSNFTDLNSFFETFARERVKLEVIIGSHSGPKLSATVNRLDQLKTDLGEDQWAVSLFKAGYTYLEQQSFLPALELLTEAALDRSAPANLKTLTLRMHQMLGVEPDASLAANEGLHLEEKDLVRLQAQVDKYKSQHGQLPAYLIDALTAEDQEMIDRLLLPLTIDPETGGVITEELLRRNEISGRRQFHMGTVERFTPEAFEKPVN
ncbi:MAG: hypothetical protein ACR2PT_04045 [Endozoicomonas sp.]